MFFGVFSVSIYVSQHKEDIFGGMEEEEEEGEQEEVEWRGQLQCSRQYLIWYSAFLCLSVCREANVETNSSSCMRQVVHGGLRGQYGLEKVLSFNTLLY